jgi:hypothetical protein
VKLSANFHDWSIKYHSRNLTFKVNERNSNNKSLKKMLKNDQKYKVISDRWNVPNQVEECCPFSATQGPLEKAIHHELVAVLQENVISSSNVTRFYSAGRPLWA